MRPPGKVRSWRQSLADDYEEEYGPLPDPIPSFGAELVTAPSTPVLSSSIAGPDALFVSQLQQGLGCLEDPPRLKCLHRPAASWDGLQFSSSDTDDPDVAPWSLQEYAAKLFARASRKAAMGGERMRSRAMHQAKQVRDEESSTKRASLRKRRRCDQDDSTVPDKRLKVPVTPNAGMHRTMLRRSLRDRDKMSPVGPDFAAWETPSPPDQSTTQSTCPLSTPPSSIESQSPPVDSPVSRLRSTRVHFHRSARPARGLASPG
ncbi:hypothetical protein CDD83_6695 [Cordyceps sp. RAO-2017]|nr:hypothetical protein CDD83_6695 [Cordyceps sp. RAO-2017]